MRFRRIGSKIRFAIICVTLIISVLIGSVIAWNVNKSIAEEGISTAELIVINHAKEFNKEFNEIENIELTNCVILVVVRFGKTRLLDNIWL